jgi:hypothetical protein
MGIWWVLVGILRHIKGLEKLGFKTSNVPKLIEAGFFIEVRAMKVGHYFRRAKER